MATNESNALSSSKRVLLQEGGFITLDDSLDEQQVTFAIGDATGTQQMSIVVPVDGAELLAASYTVISIGAVSTSGTHALAINDGTNDLATVAAFDATSAVDTIVTLTPVSTSAAGATNGKALATTAGTRLIIVNTEAGTISAGASGLFRLLWAL